MKIFYVVKNNLIYSKNMKTGKKKNKKNGNAKQ